jgi:UDP-glucose 4-epimerase
MGNSKSYLDVLLKFWPLGRFLNWLGRQPPLGHLLTPFFDRRSNHAVIIPIKKTIQGTESIVLPYALLTPLVSQATDCFVLESCLCRKAEGCQNYPVDLGCLFLGRGATRLHPSLSRRLSTPEALAHIRKAVDMGLTPLIVHASFDAFMLGIPMDKMLAICFCCDCCCTIRSSLRYGPPAFWDTVERLPGLSVQVEEGCIGCGTCLDLCHVQAIELLNGEAHIGDRCKGCGRCVEACPEGAIRMDIRNIPGMSAFLYDRITHRTDIFK